VGKKLFDFKTLIYFHNLVLKRILQCGILTMVLFQVYSGLLHVTIWNYFAAGVSVCEVDKSRHEASGHVERSVISHISCLVSRFLSDIFD
jgi:hypothetical protein